jgi:hypothetical protein
MINTPFWFKDPSILIEKESIFEFFPSKRFDIVRKLNSIVRLSIIYSLIMFLCKKGNNYLLLPPVVMVITWIIWTRQSEIHTDDIIEDSMSNKLDDLVKINDLQTECRVPTKNNPFMNPPIHEFSNDKYSQPKSCPSYNNIGVQNRIEELFDEDLYRDYKDIFKKNNSQRQFYTVPGNQVPNDQGSFAHWLYGTPQTCKEGNGIACLNNLGNSGGGSKSST